MSSSQSLVVFALDGQRYALWLSCVERILPVVEIVPLPKAPDIVMGVINFQGRVLPVMNVRRRFRLPEREVLLTDKLVVARLPKRSVALHVDDVSEVMDCPSDRVVPTKQVVEGLEYLEGIVRLEDGIILIHDLDSFLSPQEEKVLGEVMKG